MKTELPSGRKTRLRYDGSGRVAEVAHSDGSKTEFQYDLAGQLLAARNESADVRFERDALGRIVSESQDGGQTWVRSGYEAGRRRHVECDFGALQRIELGEVSRLANGASTPGTQGFLRNALGLEVERQLPGGVHVGWTRDVAGRPLERHTWRASRFAGGPEGGMNDALEARAYQWRGADQIAAIINPSQGPTFYDHDDRGRLVVCTRRSAPPAAARTRPRARGGDRATSAPGARSGLMRAAGAASGYANSVTSCTFMRGTRASGCASIHAAGMSGGRSTSMLSPRASVGRMSARYIAGLMPSSSQVARIEKMTAARRPPSCEPTKSAFLRTIAMRRKRRSVRPLSMGMRPSLR